MGSGREKGEGGDTFNAARNAASSVVVTMLAFPSIFGRNSLLRAAMTGSQPRTRIVLADASPAEQSPAPCCVSRSIRSRAESYPDMARADWDNTISSATLGTTPWGRLAGCRKLGCMFAKGDEIAAAKQGSTRLRELSMSPDRLSELENHEPTPSSTTRPVPSSP